MRYPKELFPVAYEEIELDAKTIARLPKAMPIFRRWHGDPPKDNYGGKPILDVDGQPGFAELEILRLFKTANWHGVWIDTFKKLTRTGMDTFTSLPPEQDHLLELIYSTSGTRSGCFDIFCWNNCEILFAEAKRKGHDRIRSTQIKWLNAALKIGIPIESLLVVEWEIKAES